MTKQKTFKFYSDSGHGWLCVPFSTIQDLGLEDKISTYSFVYGDKVYLEEDCDYSAFLNAWKAKGLPEFKTKEFYSEQSKIRGYAMYSKANALLGANTKAGQCIILFNDVTRCYDKQATITSVAGQRVYITMADGSKCWTTKTGLLQLAWLAAPQI